MCEAVLDLGSVLRTIKVAMPCVVGIDSSMNVPRLPTVLQVMKVKADRIDRLSLGQLGLTPGEAELAASATLAASRSGAVERKRIVHRRAAGGERRAARRHAEARGGAVMGARFVVSAATVAELQRMADSSARGWPATTASWRPSPSRRTAGCSRPRASRPTSWPPSSVASPTR